MTKTISILSHYPESTCEVLNCSVKIKKLNGKTKLKNAQANKLRCVFIVSINLIY